MNNSVYQRPNKPRRLTVKNRRDAPEMAFLDVPEVIEIDSFTECHVTPLNVGCRMVDYLELNENDKVLEPQAGTGNLVQALLDSNHPLNNIVAIERHIGLCNGLAKRFNHNLSFDPINQCFLEYAQEAAGKVEYPRILLNPPFKMVRKHMNAALSLLGSGKERCAIMIALVPITYHHEEAETLEELPRDTFHTVSVSTKIIQFSR